MRMIGVTKLFSFVALVAFAVSACDGGTMACQTIYDQCSSLIISAEDGFINKCSDKYHESGDNCQGVLQNFSQCVDDNGCSVFSCTDDYVSVVAACGIDTLGLPFGI